MRALLTTLVLLTPAHLTRAFLFLTLAFRFLTLAFRFLTRAS
jgi:hypothetical protein